MTVLLVLAWGLPLFIVPALGGLWPTYHIPRATLLVFLCPLLVGSWWRGKWTWTEWVLVIGIILQTARSVTPWSLGRGLVWLAGLVVLRAVRGLRPADRMFLRRWWWLPAPLVVSYACLQMWIPEAEPIGWRSLQAGSSTYGNTLYTAEALLLLLGQSPWWMGAAALLMPVALGSRGALLAGLGGGTVARRRPAWRILLLVFALAAGLLWWKHDTLSGQVRLQIWGRTVELIAAHPLVGVGTGYYRFHVRQGDILEQNNWIGTAHQDYLERMAEWGVPLGLVFAWWVLSLCRHSWGHAAVAAVALVQFPFNHPATWALWCLTAGFYDTERGVSPWLIIRGSLVRNARGVVSIKPIPSPITSTQAARRCLPVTSACAVTGRGASGRKDGPAPVTAPEA